MKLLKPVSTISKLLLASAILAGCATTVDLGKFHDADLREAEIMPSKDQLKQKRIKLVVFEADNAGLSNAQNANLGATFAAAVEKEVTAAGTEVVDRNLAQVLSNELKLAESGGAGMYSGPQVAQFAIRGKVTSAEYGAAYVEASTWKDDKGEYHTNPAHYNHAAKVSGTLSLYELPSLRLVKTISYTGQTTDSEPNGANAGKGAAMLRTAEEYAISDQAHQLKNMFAPKGYVVERRTDGKVSIFKVLMGHEQGIHAEDKVVIYSLRKKMNALTGQEQIDEVPVAQGKISDQVTAEESWVVLDNQDAAAQIRLGDFVRVKYDENSMFAKIMR